MRTKLMTIRFLILILSFCFQIIASAQLKGNPEYSKQSREYIHTPNSVFEQNWKTDFTIPGVTGTVYALATDGTNIYAGGQFTSAGGTVANNVVMWDGNQWHSIGEGDENGVSGSVEGLIFYNGKLFVGGSFSRAGTKPANSVAYWDGNEWHALGNDSTNGVRRWDISFGGDTIITGGSVWSMGLYKNYIMLGGFFNLVGTDSTDGIGGWNVLTQKWETFNGGLANIFPDDPPYAFAFAASGDDLFIGGKFSFAGGVPAKGFAKWDGSGWSEVGGGANNWVRDMCFDDQGNLYAVGMFDTIGTVRVSGIAKWDGVSISSLGSGIAPHPSAQIPDVISVEFLDGQIFVSGGFNLAGNTVVSGIAKWNGISWQSVGTGLGFAGNGNIGVGRDIQKLDNRLFIGGDFTKAGDIFVSNIIEWNNTLEQYSKLSDGTPEKGIYDGPSVYTVAYSGSDVYVGGSFSVAGGIVANNIAKLTPSGWEPLGNGTNGPVESIFIDGNDVYVGGTFAIPVNSNFSDTAFHVAKWNGSEWLPVGIGVGGTAGPVVRTIKRIGEYIYLGGNFAFVGDSVNFIVPANSIARYNLNTRQMEALGNGLEWFQGFPGYVNSIEGDENKVYAGGLFFYADGNPVNALAVWENNAWGTVGSPGNDGVNGVVYTLKKAGNDLYIGGDFERSGTGNLTSLVKWNGSDWEEVYGGIYLNGALFENPYVSAIDIHDNKLFIAGNFDKAGNTDVSNLAIWDSEWLNPGGVNNLIFDLDVSGNNLFIGGGFTVAGGVPSVKVGSYDIITSIDEDNNELPDKFVLYQNFPNPFNPSTTIKFNLKTSGHVSLKVFDLLGQEVITLLNKELESGNHTVNFNAAGLNSGVYFYRVDMKGSDGSSFTSTRKMILIK